MTKTGDTQVIRPLESLLLSLDTTPWDALYRVAIGFLTVPALSRLAGKDPSAWALGLFLIGVLLTLRLLPAALRVFVPFSGAARTIWAQRRQNAKRYDSYQWRKLFWIGLGLALYTVLSGEFNASKIAVSSFCLLSGTIGLARWKANAPQLNFKAADTKQASHPASNGA